MTTPFAQRLEAVDAALLTPLARQVLADDNAQVLAWAYQPVAGGMAHAAGASYGIYRFRGQAHSQGQVRPWSLILKATAAAVVNGGNMASADISDLNYWKRETLVYQSGMLADLPEGLVAARCFGVVEYPDQEFWIWLEDVADQTWSRADYGTAAYHLGQFNGAYLCGRPIPQVPWLARGQARHWLPLGEPGMLDIQRLIRLPANQLWFDDDTAARPLRLWAARERLLAGLERLPRTLCHHDAFRRNLMIRRNTLGEPETVAIDWAMVGSGSVGAEVANLVGGGVSFYDIPAADAKEYEAVVLEGYMAGLRNAGWQGSPELVRFGFAATTVLHQGLGLTGMILLLLANEEGIRFYENFFGGSIRDLLPQRAIYQRYYYDLGEEALALLDKLAAAGQL